LNNWKAGFTQDLTAIVKKNVKVLISLAAEAIVVKECL
jgi:hypothetical protein